MTLAHEGGVSGRARITHGVALALGVSIAVGVIFGVGPARSASRLDPVEALRQE